jgi:hypothetical protein
MSPNGSPQSSTIIRCREDFESKFQSKQVFESKYDEERLFDGHGKGRRRWHTY